MLRKQGSKGFLLQGTSKKPQRQQVLEITWQSHTHHFSHLCIRIEGRCSKGPFILEVVKIQASSQVGNSQKQEDKKVGLGSALVERVRGGFNHSRKGCLPGKTTQLQRKQKTANLWRKLRGWTKSQSIMRMTFPLIYRCCCLNQYSFSLKRKHHVHLY